MDDRLRILIDSSADEEGFVKVKLGYQEIEQANEKTKQRSQLFFTELQSAYRTFSQVVQRAWAFLEDAAAQQNVRQGFERLSAQAGISSAELLNAMDEAAAGTISANTLMLSSNRLLRANFGVTSKEISDLLLIARDRARDFGISTEEAFNRLVLGVTRGSVEMLDELGIVARLGEATEQYAATLGTTADQLTATQRAQALYRQILRDNASGVQELRGQTLGMADSLGQVETSWANFVSQLEEFISNAQPVQDILNGIANGLDNAGTSLQGIAAFLEQANVQAEVFANTGLAGLAETAGFDVLEDAARRMEIAAGRMQDLGLGEQFLQLGRDLSYGRVGMVEWRQDFEALLAQVEEGHQKNVLNVFYEQIQNGNVSLFDASEVLEGLLFEMERIPDPAEAAASAIGQVTEAAIDNSAAMERAANRIADLNKDITSSLSDINSARGDFAKWAEESEAKHQQKLTEIATRGEQDRTDIQIGGQDKTADLLVRRNDGLVDAEQDGTDQRFDINQEYWDKINELTRHGITGENEAIRARDARALTAAREGFKEKVDDAEAQRQIDIRNNEQAEQRKLRDTQTAYRRGERDLQTYLQRQYRDQATAEQRSIQLSQQAYTAERNLKRAQYTQEEAEHQAHLQILISQRAAAARAMAGITAPQFVTNPNTGAQVPRYDVGTRQQVYVSNGRSRTADLNR